MLLSEFCESLAQQHLEGLSKQTLSGHFCDVTFHADEFFIWAHSSLLACFSPYLARLLSNALSTSDRIWSSKRPLRIDISSITKCKKDSKINCFSCLKKVINFIYTGKIEIDNEHLHHLLVISSNLENDDLLVICKQFTNGSHSSGVTDLRNGESENPKLLSPNENQMSLPLCKTFTCLDCQYASRSIDNFTQHLTSKEHLVNSNSFICQLYESPQNRPFRCSKCSQTFALKELWFEHSCSSKSSPDNSQNAMYFCSICSFSHSDIEQLKRHTYVFHNNFYRCLTCELPCRKLLDIVNHLVDVKHREMSCSICLFEADHSDSLIDHVKTHLSKLPFNCSSCDRGFYGRKDWLNHTVSSHSSTDPFQCDKCNESFKTYLSLNQHFARIHAPKKFVCSLCDFSCGFKCLLDRHMKRHSEFNVSRRKVDTTSESSKLESISDKIILKKSIDQSTKKSKEKSLKCSICDHVFTKEKNVIRHMNSIHHVDSKSKRLSCPKCDYYSFRSDKFKNHITIRHPEVNYEMLKRHNDAVGNKVIDSDSNNSESKGGTLPTTPDDSQPPQNQEHFQMESQFANVKNTLLVNETGDISIVNSNETHHLKLLNIGNLTGSITLDESTGVLTLNNINSGSVYLNEITGELTYINLENEKPGEINYFGPEPAPTAKVDLIKLDEVTGEIIKIQDENEPMVPNEKLMLLENTLDDINSDMDVNDDSLDGFDDFDEMIFDSIYPQTLSDVEIDAFDRDKTSDLRADVCGGMPRLDESTGLLTFDQSYEPIDSSSKRDMWARINPFEQCPLIAKNETYELLLDEVTGVMHD